MDMVIVTLKDGTEFNIDTDSESMARMIVEHKLRDQLDYRKIKKTKLIPGVRMDASHKKYNSGNTEIANHYHVLLVGLTNGIWKVCGV